MLERGAVEGEVFHRGASRRCSEDGQVTPRLAALVRKELIRPDKPQLPGEDAFRFRHLLIRDAAYDALPKATRAELHERFAAWLEERGADLVELDEILGYHLEQAARYKAELGQPDAVLAERAGERLAARAGARSGVATIGLRPRCSSGRSSSPGPSRSTSPRARPGSSAGEPTRARLPRSPSARPSERGAAGDRPGEALARVVAAYAPLRVRARVGSRSSSDSHARLCRCSSGQTITRASATCGTRSAYGVANTAVAGTSGREPRSRLSATARSPARHPVGRSGLGAASLSRAAPCGRGAADARCRLPRIPIPGPAPPCASCSRCSAASTRRGQLARPGERAAA